MVECGNGCCKNGQWFHFNCVGLKRSPKKDEHWYCSNDCSEVVRKGGDQQDGIYQYSKALMWGGLSDMIRRQAVRYNDGPMMLTYWKKDMMQFLTRNHTKYFVLAHRLIVGTNGFLQERLRQDLIWNRTVNIRGGRGYNDETDLVNEFLNREFKDSIRHLGGQTSESTLDRHGKLAGGLGKVLDETFGSIVDLEGRPGKNSAQNRRDDMSFLVETLKPENLTSIIPGRRHSAFPGFDTQLKINVDYLEKRITKLSKKLDRARRVANQ